MSTTPVLETPRLCLREWREGDLESFAAMNADREVMRHFPAALTREQSDAFVERIRGTFVERGFGLWAVEVRESQDFAGFIGLEIPRFSAPFMPCVEVGWRLAREFWGQGYAPEGALAAMAHGFGPAGLEEIVSFTAEGNAASRRVMEKLGMTRNPHEDFDHPSVEVGSALRRHVLYRLSRDAFARKDR
ncbi:MAG: GNAT family N-acetyltransferase [Deltaproteobacteria bacterium]|nr:GNAT family N-acetyltransferase [Deltaproteobacteria bacterium]MBW2394398.1 GNAT family N-acetyltransferase [Deltaproteobacteria bacterium]